MLPGHVFLPWPGKMIFVRGSDLLDVSNLIENVILCFVKSCGSKFDYNQTVWHLGAILFFKLPRSLDTILNILNTLLEQSETITNYYSSRNWGARIIPKATAEPHRTGKMYRHPSVTELGGPDNSKGYHGAA